MDSDALLQSLQSSSGHGGLYDCFSSFFLPFADFIPIDSHHPSSRTKRQPTSATALATAPKRRAAASKKKKPEDPEAKVLRPLAKQFLPFLCRALQLLPSLLRKNSKSSSSSGGGDEDDEERVAELLGVYRLSIDCLACIGPCLAGKPYSVHLQRGRLVCTLEACGRYSEAEEEAWDLLESLRSVLVNAPSVPKGQKGKNAVTKCILPDPKLVGAEDPEVTTLSLEIIMSLLGCLYKSSSRNGAAYERILALVDQVQPWLQFLDTKMLRKYHLLFVNTLYRCSLFLLGEYASFDEDLVIRFCLRMFTECLNSSSIDNFPNMTRKICSSIEMQWAGGTSLIIHLLRLTLKSMICGCKVDVPETVNEFLEAVSYLCGSIYALSRDICRHASEVLFEQGDALLQVSSPIASILNLYALGLYFKYRSIHAEERVNATNPSNDALLNSLIFDSEEIVHKMTKTLGFLAKYFHVGSHSKEELTSSEVECSDDEIAISVECKRFRACGSLNGQASWISYLEGLEFLCKPLIEHTNTAWKHLSSQKKPVCSLASLTHVQEAFHQFCELILSALRSITIPEKDKAKLHETHGTLLQVSASALKISLLTAGNYQKSLITINCIISSTWIEVQDLKYLISAFYNIGALFYNNRQLEKASIALELCCKTIWAHIKLVSCAHSNRLKGIHIDNISCNEIKDSINDAFSRVAMIVDVLHKRGAKNINDIIIKSLYEFTVLEDIFQDISGSLALVKQWVKITVNDLEDVEVVDDTPVLYHLLLGYCSTWSKRTISKILEQELVAYGLMESRNPNFCQRMQQKVLNILLNDIYTTQDFYFQRSRILVRKGRTMRAGGIEGLNRCIECLSEAISLLSDASHGSAQTSASVYHQLALTHCLYALSAQEASQDWKVILHNVQCAINLWSRMDCHTSCDNVGEFGKESTIPLLCCTLDLLSLKGCLKFQPELCKLMISFCIQEDVPIEKCFSMLWNHGRLNHSLCFSPINEDLLFKISEQLGVAANSINYWISYLEGHPPSLCLFLQKFLLGDSIVPEVILQSSRTSFGAIITVEEIKRVASSLLNVSSSSQSISIAGYLYQDLAQRLFMSGRIFEALSYARKALHLRKKMLRRKFIYSVEHQSGISQSDKAAESSHVHGRLEALGSVITEVWPINKSGSVEDFAVSPWSVLRCYLESTLQVAVIHQSAGNGAEAEVLLRTGKEISCSQKFPVIAVAFSLALGKLYCGKYLFDLAENELNNAKKLLVENELLISCPHCKLAFEVSIDMHMGDLSRTIFDNSNQFHSSRSLSHALGLYRAALQKLELSETFSIQNKADKVDPMPSRSCNVKTQIAKVATDVESPACNICAALKQIRNVLYSGQMPLKCNGSNHSNVGIGKYVGNTEVMKKTRKPSRNSAKDINLKSQTKQRKTRSSNRIVNRASEIEGEVGINRDGSADHELCSDSLIQGDSGMKPDEATKAESGPNEKLLLNEDRCWPCLLIQVMGAGFMHDIIHLKWECHRRHIALMLLLKIAKCLGTYDGKHEEHEVHEIFGRCISLLFVGNSLQNHSGTLDSCLVELLVDESIGDVFPLERAAILYNMSWFSLSNILSEHPRTKCCILSKIQMPTVVPWLLGAFILCQELPLLYQKVSKLLSCIFILSTVDDSVSLPLQYGKSLPSNYWAAYFHQASIGTCLQYQYLSKLSNNSFKTGASEDLPTATATVEEKAIQVSQYFRFAPKRLEDLESHVMNFFQSLPSVPIVCLSMLGGDYVNLIGEMLLLPSFFPAWILLSRLNSNRQPVIMLLPVDLIQEELQLEDHSSGKQGRDKDSECTKQWQCPWGYTVVDHVAPSFKLLLEENYLSLCNTTFTQDDLQKKCAGWWSQRTMLNNHLDRLLKSMEDSWLGSWGCLLLGELTFQDKDMKIQKIIDFLKSQSKFEINDTLFKAIIYGAKSLADAEACIHQLLLYKGYFGRGACCGEERFRVFSAASQIMTCDISQTVHDFLSEAFGEKNELPVEREPVILVLDSNVQMLPWESIPILRDQEVYRMPSVGITLYTLHRCSRHNKKNLALGSSFPAVDPFRTYYLLNPSGDLSGTQAEFEEWFRNQNWKGKAGDIPTTEELIFGLQNHDLFLYFGHGSGTQYISVNEIQKLDDCAATLLMGCSSGSLVQKGPYAPQGAPLSYLFAGSPAVIGNLWDVSDKDIDRFAKAIISSWLQEESVELDTCIRCSQLSKQFGCMTVDGDGNSTSIVTGKRPKGKKQQLAEVVCKGCGRKRITSRMSQARESCRLKLLIGASPVCYGVPTAIWKES